MPSRSCVSVFTRAALLTFAILLLPPSALGQAVPTPADPIAYALSAGPPDIRAQATVMDDEGNVLRQGTNGWTCFPTPDQPMCVDQQWMTWIDAYMNRRDEVNVTSMGIAYMLRGDAGASNIDPFAEGPTANNQWVRTGPHLMIIVPDTAMLAGIPSDPATGGPYVMWRGHPLVHVMVPLTEDGARLRQP